MTRAQSIDGGSTSFQPGILTPAPPLARSLTTLLPGCDVAGALGRLLERWEIADGIIDPGGS